MGERLGYNDIKIGIPLSLATMDTYMRVYAESILAFQSKSNRLNGTDEKMPFVFGSWL